MKKKKSSLLLATAASIIGITVFGTVVGLASKVKYRGVNPTQGVISQLGLIDSVAFKPSVAHFTSDYNTVKKAILGDKTFNASSAEFADFVNKFDFLTNNGNTVLAIPKKYQVVIQSFTAEDDKQRFRLSFYLKETLADGNVAQSATKTIYLSPVDAPKAALAQYSHIVDNNFANLIQNPLSHFSSSSVKPLGLTRSADFAKKLNEFQNEDDLKSYLSKFFDIETLKANIRLQAQGFGFAKGDLEEPFVYSFVKNPQNSNEFATNLDQEVNTVRLYLKTEFSPEAKAALKDYKAKDESYTTAIDLKAVNNTTLFANNTDLESQLDVNLLDAADYYGIGDRKINDNSEVEKLPEAFQTLKQRDESRLSSSDRTLPKFSLFSYDALTFYQQMQELVAKPEAIKDIIDASLERGLTFSFGKYDLLFDNLRQHLDYQFLVSEAKIKQNSLSKKLFIEIPIKIKLMSSIFGDSGSDKKVVLEKTVSFKLDNFRNVSIEKAFGVLYPGVDEELKKAKEEQEKAKAIEKGSASQLSSTTSDDDEDEDEKPVDSPIQFQPDVEKLAIGSSALKPYEILLNHPDKYLLAKSEINELIKAKNYQKLAELISDSSTYNVPLRLKDELFNNNVRIPSSKEIENANFAVDETDATVFSKIYSASSSVFQNKTSLYAYYRYLLSLSPKETIEQLVKLAKKVGLKFEGYENLPINFNLEDLKNVKITTNLDNRNSNESSGGADGIKFKLALLDFNNYFANDVKKAEEGLPIFLPAKLTDDSSSSNTSKNWREQIIEEFKNQNQQDQLGQLPLKVWQKIIGDEKEQDVEKTVKQKIFKKFQESLATSRKASFWNDSSSSGSSNEPFKNSDFAQISNLQDLVFAFYSSAALADNWKNYQQNGAKPAIIFEAEDEKENKDANVYQLKFHYAIGFADNAGKFNEDVIKSSTRTIYLKTSGRSKAEVSAIKQLNETIQNAPLGIQNVFLDSEKFAVLQTLASSIAEKNNPQVEEEIDNPKPEDTTWVHDEIKRPAIPQIQEEKQPDWFEGKLKNQQVDNNSQSSTPTKVAVSTFANISESPFFSTNFQDSQSQDNTNKSKTDQSNNNQAKKEAALLKEKLAILLGQQFIQYYQLAGEQVEFEILKVEKLSQTSFKVEFKLAKTVNDNNVIAKVVSDESMTLIVNTALTKAPELAKKAQVSDTEWLAQYNPQNPLAAKTKFSLEFKEKIPLDEKGAPTSEWLASVPVVIHQQLLKLTPVVKSTNDVRIELNSSKSDLERKEDSDSSSSLAEDKNYYILNPQTKTHWLTLNNAINNDSNFKIENLKVKNNNEIEFDLRANNIKRLINTPITFAGYSPFTEGTALQIPEVRNQILNNINKEISKENFNQIFVELNKNDDTNPSKSYVMIKPKYIIERTVGVPWATGYDGYEGEEKDLITKYPESNALAKRDLIQILKLKNTDYAKNQAVGLSVKVFDPDNVLGQIKSENQKNKEEIKLKSYDLYQNPEQQNGQKLAKGWTNIHPNQRVIQNENQKLPENYLNVILNKPWKVTLYNSSDFISNLFSQPDNKTKFKKVVARKVNNNFVDWGTAYLTLWYPQNLIQQQPNIISANIDQLLLKDHMELKNNQKLIAPNITQWWPNIQNFTEAKVKTEKNDKLDSQLRVELEKIQQKQYGWLKIRYNGFTLQALKSKFRRKSRTFTLTTTVPTPLQKYSIDFKSEDWRLVFQNEENQIAMLRAEEDTQSNDKKKWIEFKVRIPDEMFSSNVRFVGIMKQADNQAQWLPIVNTSTIFDYRGIDDPSSTDLFNIKKYKQIKGLGLTNNAFNNVFKEFNIHRKTIK
ncbi:P97 family adhesin [Mesomycoplasma dispar]|uniref:Cell surface protein n=1 Tax=Mesomycoplasma dispar TaxID=86660 RepID=A0ABN5DZJ6_9BACT|nr:cell surface protein [Mesomycoplasma dispar]ATP59792.1 cell surface protein [Mesomycoplasma dispar]